jgi:hypothetical protein
MNLVQNGQNSVHPKFKDDKSPEIAEMVTYEIDTRSQSYDRELRRQRCKNLQRHE